MSKQISFLHAADLHLDSPFKGLARIPEEIFKEVQESTFIALDRLVNVAINKQVNFVLLVGDLFDNEKQSLKGQIHLRDAFEKLKRHHIYVYLSYGNHDYLNGNHYPITYPENVFTFQQETIQHFLYEQNGETLASIYGFSYENRAVHDNKAIEFPELNDAIPFHIAMLHGSLQSNTEHDVYAPFQLSDLSKQHFDYWALGHIHKREILSVNPPIIYPGNIQGRNRKESGEKGCYHVVLNEVGAATTSFIPLQALCFENVSVDISECDQPHQLEIAIQHALVEQYHNLGPILVSLTLTSTNPEHQQWETDGILTDIVELLNESARQQTNWFYIYTCIINITTSLADTTLAKGEHFLGELVRHAEEASIQPFMKELYQHKQARKYLPSLSDEEQETIKNEAQQYLMRELLYNGGE
ncbi:metallophosphoesterase family protein [Lentibacillus sp. Marseille-P4043]|uniref:metallophosphoesterase family protein n=1 Tax=Lentibacillus sp. Marseille-P4043 TaxID=2040293 RepID=UPI000D0AEE0D|nr:DNA repair exonuclease [Lentibacillus sp. Marseille-P4043]